MSPLKEMEAAVIDLDQLGFRPMTPAEYIESHARATFDMAIALAVKHGRWHLRARHFKGPTLRVVVDESTTAPKVYIFRAAGGHAYASFEPSRSHHRRYNSIRIVGLTSGMLDVLWTELSEHYFRAWRNHRGNRRVSRPK